MRAHGEGNIRVRKDGRWEASIRAGGTRRYIYGKTRAEVAAKLKELQGQATTGRLVEPAKVTVAAFLTDWLEANRSRLRASTIESYTNLLRCHALPTLGNLKLQALKPLHLVRLYSERPNNESRPGAS